MTAQVETSWVKAFHSNLKLLLQQENTKIAQYTDPQSFVGEEGFWDRIGEIDPQPAAGRGAETVVTEVSHDRRKCTFDDYELATYVAPTDLERMLTDPTSAYARAFIAGFNRKKDLIVRNAFFATVSTGKTGTGSTTFPAGQDVTTTGGATVAKFLSAKMLLLGAEIPEGSEIHVAIDVRALEQLLADEKAINRDYGFTALMNADAQSLRLLGMQWHLYNNIETDASGGAQNGRRMYPVWVREGMAVHMATDVTVAYDRLPTKSMANQLFASLGMGATRMEEEMVVRVYCSAS